MSDVIDKILLHWETGIEKEIISDDGEPLSVKITQVKVKDTFLSPQQIEEAKTKITNSIALVDAVLEIQKPLEIAEIQSQLNAIQGVGDIVKGVVKLIPGAPNPMIGKLNELEKKIEKLGEKMTENFAEIKSFITEVKFFIHIMAPASTLMACLRDCLRNPQPEAAQNFKRAYKKHSPLHLAYKLMTYLEKRSTNPLKMAMDAEKAKTKATFEKWIHIFKQILAQFLFMEGFATGVLGMHGSYTWDLLIERAKEVLAVIIPWKEDYLKDEGYWQEVKEFLPKYLTANINLTLEEKSKQIAAKLETYLTSDSFYVMVSQIGGRYSDCQIHCPPFKEQLIELWAHAGCSAFIYRSRDAHKKTEEEHKQIKSEVESCRNSLKYNAPNLRDFLKKEVLDTKKVTIDGILYLMTNTKNCHIQVANSPGHEYGPGWWVTANIDNFGRTWPFKFLAAFY